MRKNLGKIRMLVGQIKDIWRYELWFRGLLAMSPLAMAVVLLWRAESGEEMLVALGASLIALFFTIKLGTLALWYLEPPQGVLPGIEEVALVPRGREQFLADLDLEVPAGGKPMAAWTWDAIEGALDRSKIPAFLRGTEEERKRAVEALSWLMGMGEDPGEVMRPRYLAWLHKVIIRHPVAGSQK